MAETEQKETGKVWLVGAGPSDPGLMTLRGRQVIENADVVVYDALVGQGILSMIPEGTELIYVGKRSGNHAMPQEEISRLLADLALKGKRVVRLKGGDPFLFGRGGEELEVLSENHIPFEVVPGITAAISVPAYQGIPVTHRDFCSSVHIITGHKRDDLKNAIDFDALVRTGGTLIFLMGVTALGEICQGLLDAGMSPDLPAALLMRGTTAHQRRIVATVGTLREEVDRQGAETPAVIIVGDVCALADDFSWYEKMPLGGAKVMVTRPADLAGETVEKLKILGADVVVLPMIRTVRRKDNTKLWEALSSLEKYQWLVFTSPTGVRIFFEELRERKLDVRKLGTLRIAAIGTGTKRALAERGIYADLVPETYDGEHLGEALAGAGQPGERVLIPRAAVGNPQLVEKLSDMIVDDIPSYDTVFEEIEDRETYQSELENGEIDYVLFTSSSCVRGFAESFRDLDLSQITAVCIGEQTKRTADSLGMSTYMAQEAETDSLIERLAEVYQADRKTQKSDS